MKSVDNRDPRLKRGGRPWGKACRQAVPIGGIGTAGRDKRDMKIIIHLLAKESKFHGFFHRICRKIYAIIGKPAGASIDQAEIIEGCLNV